MENDLIQDTNLDLLQVQVASVEYTGQAPINVDNQEHIISLDQSALSSKLDTSAFDEWTATHSGTEYSAGDGIDITDHVISVTGQLTGDYLTKASADTLYYPLESNPSGYLTAHQDLSEYAKTDDLSAYQPVGDYYSASNPSGFITGVDLSEYYKKNETSSKEEISSVVNEINNTITNLSSKYYPLNSNPSGYLTAHQDISDKLDVTAFTSYTATAQGTEYTAGENINITNHVISGKDWTSTIESATTGKLDASAFNSGDFYPMTGNPSGFITGVDLTPYQEKTGMTAYQSVSGMTAFQPVGDYYSASNPSGFITGVDLSNYYEKNETSSKEEISAALTSKLDESAFTEYTATAVQGIEYTGIAPIDVNNTTHEISADVWTLSAGNGLRLTEDVTSKITTLSITGSAGGGSTISWYTDTPAEHTSADIDLTIQTTASLGGGYDRNLLDGNGNFIGALIPSAASEDLGKVLTITAGSPRWQNLPETPSGAYGIKTEVVANSGLATGQNILYIVTGN